MRRPAYTFPRNLDGMTFGGIMAERRLKNESNAQYHRPDSSTPQYSPIFTTHLRPHYYPLEQYVVPTKSVYENPHLTNFDQMNLLRLPLSTPLRKVPGQQKEHSHGERQIEGIESSQRI